MDEDMAEALAAFRACNYEHIYLREASVAQGTAVVAVLRALVEHYADRPNAIPAVKEAGGLPAGTTGAVTAAVSYVAGMTDRFAFRHAVAELGWDPRQAAQERRRLKGRPGAPSARADGGSGGDAEGAPGVLEQTGSTPRGAHRAPKKSSAAGVTVADIGTCERSSLRARGDISTTSMRNIRPK